MNPDPIVESYIADHRDRSGCDCKAPYLPHPRDEVSPNRVIILGRVIHHPSCRLSRVRRMLAAARWN